MLNRDNECRLQIGEFCCGLRFAEPAYVLSVKDYFNNFISEKEPDIIVDIEIILHEEDVHVPDSLCISKTVEGNSFNYSSGLIKGNIDLSIKKCFIQVKNALLSDPTVRIFEQFFHQLYYTLLENKHDGEEYNQLLLHSCSVLKNGRGYVFTGPSGSGKTTVAQLSTKYDVLNDEISLVTKANGHYLIHATPFNGFFRMKKNMAGPLTKIFFLKQDSKNYIKKVRMTDCIIPFAREIVPPIGILSKEKSYPLSIMIDFAIQLLSDVPFFELHFLPDKHFWECVKELE